ncbi:MAG: HlyD family efflux transporter periplasmic adaptor subunit [Gammaproteobacteria bacterium]|nr:HlyD family efflux transporter periplasmic adaptor subunit [Gammaproteobacteria bacterium]
MRSWRRGAVLLLGCLVLMSCGRTRPHLVGSLEWDRIELVAEASEPITAIYVKEGDHVTQGQALLQLDPRRLQAQRDEASAAQGEVSARFAELKRGTRVERLTDAQARLQGAQDVLTTREREVKRLQELYTKNLISLDAVDQAKLSRDSARAERDRARATLDELQHGSTREELQQAQQAVARNAAAARVLELTLDRLTVRAPSDGRLDSLPYKLGERPPAGNVVAVLLAGDKPYARVYIPEAQRVHVIPGTQAQVTVDGIAQSFAGVVRSVASDASFTPYFALTEHDRGHLGYLAEVDIHGDVGQLPAGVPLNVTLDTTANNPK